MSSSISIGLETVQSLREDAPGLEEFLANTTQPKKFGYLTHSKPLFALFYFDCVVVSILTIQSLLDVLAVPSLTFYRKDMTLYKGLAIMSLPPSWAIVIMNLSHFQIKYSMHNALIVFIFILYVVRSLRLFYFLHLARYYRPLGVLLLSIKASTKELILLVMLLLFGMVLFGNLIYFAEIFDMEIASIPYGFWWAIITMTTVGYGDVHPVNTFGYVIGAVCAITGIIIAAVPIPVITNNFEKYYSCVKKMESILERDKRLEEKNSYRENGSLYKTKHKRTECVGLK